MIQDDPYYQTAAEENLQIVKDELSDAEKRIAVLEAALQEIYDMHEDEMDAHQDCEGTWHPNREMRICTLIEEAVGKGRLK